MKEENTQTRTSHQPKNGTSAFCKELKFLQKVLQACTNATLNH